MTTRAEREEILGNIVRIVKEKFINPNNLDQDLDTWAATAHAKKLSILDAADNDQFELEVVALLKDLGASHTALIRGNGTGIPAPHAINATLRAFETNRGLRWVFQDVIEDGLAFRAGIVPGDVLLAQDDVEVTPPKPVRFSLGARHLLCVFTSDTLKERTVEIILPPKAAKDRPPMIEPKSISGRSLPHGIGVLRIASFPGAGGRGFANKLDGAIGDLLKAGCSRLVLDLRGNLGGGLGSLRLMSYLTPHRVPVGYSLTRSRLRKGFTKEALPRIAAVPRNRIQEIAMAVRFGIIQKDRSIALLTEGLGPQPFHGRTVVLINEHTHSAAEMVAAFSDEGDLAKIAGSRSAGEVLGGANFQVGGGYRLRLPVAAWYTWSGRTLEGRGVEPSAAIDIHFEALRQGIDSQFDAAVKLAEQF